MNLLLDLPPTSVRIGGREYEINSDFRASILFELLMQDDEIDLSTKAEKAIGIYFPNGYPGRESLQDVFSAILWFFGCGRTEKERHLRLRRRSSDRDDDSSSQNRQYSFDYDDEYIYAAFRQQYGINLVEIEYLHWWEFRALFRALTEDCEIVKIMGYRTIQISPKMSEEQKSFYRKMKAEHALPIPEKELEESEALLAALMNGGDVDAILRKNNDDE